MRLSYDAETDILYVDFVERHQGQVTRFVNEGLLAEVNAGSGAVEGFEVWDFRRRASEGDGIEVPFGPGAPLPQAVARVS